MMLARQRSQRRSYVAVAFAVIAAVGLTSACGASGGSGGSGDKSLTSVSIALPTTGSYFLPFYVGQTSGLYKKAGLNVTIKIISTPAEPAALLSGQVQFIGALGYVGEAIAGNPKAYPIKIVETTGVFAPFTMVGAKDVTSLKQVEGKAVAAYPGNPTNTAEAMLERGGVPAGQYTVVNGGVSAAARFALLRAGRVSAALVDPNDVVADPVKGYPILATGAGIRDIGTGLAVTQKMISSNRSLVQRVVDATAAAGKLAATDMDASVAGMKAGMASLNLNYTDQQWQQAWKASKYMFNETGVPVQADIDSLLQSAVVADKLSSTPDPSTVFDLDFVKK